MRMWRAGADLTLKEAAAKASELLPHSYSMSYETVRRWERNGFPPHGPDPIMLSALVIALGHKIGELPEGSRADVEMVTEMAMRNRCISREPQAGAQKRRSSDRPADTHEEAA